MIITIALVLLVIISVLGFAASVSSPAGRARRAERAKQAERYCTKHVIQTSLWGGPDRLVWQYGTHRTQGNECDGPEHRRVSTYLR